MLDRQTQTVNTSSRLSYLLANDGTICSVVNWTEIPEQLVQSAECGHRDIRVVTRKDGLYSQQRLTGLLLRLFKAARNT